MKRFFWGLTVAAGMVATGIPSMSFAQTTKEVEVLDKTAEEDVDPNTGGLTFTGGIDVVSAYFFRGYNQEDGGLIAQPYLTGSVGLVSTDDFTLSGYISTWNSFQSQKTLAAPTGPSAWYESDIVGGLDVGIGKTGFTAGVVYTFYTYPNGAFKTIQEVGFKVGYDDSKVMEEMKVPFALKPYFGVYIETDDGNGTEDTYGELGVAPSFGLGESGVTLSVPVTLGLSFDDYYLNSDGDNDLFGYVGIGLYASIPLGKPGKYGAWSLVAGGQYLNLLSDSTENANNGEENQFIGKVGVTFAY